MAFIEFQAVTKRFAGVTALDAVSLAVERAECHALMGENGAGKSTLGKVLAGIHRPDGGQVLIGGARCQFHSPRDAMAAGVGIVHQELAFCPDLSVAENLCMGHYPRRLAVLADRRAMEHKARALLVQIGAPIDVEQPMRMLSTAQEQMVQIAAAVGTGARILVFDEPTSSLSEPEAQRLFALIGQLKGRGVTVIYVSHRLPEVFQLCDRISVLRDGRYIGTLARAQATPTQVVQMMVGRPVADYVPGFLHKEPGRVMMSVQRLSSPGLFQEVSFDVRAGEIVGLAGLVGAGRSEVSRALFGLDKNATGRIEVDGRQLPPRSVRRAKSYGLGLVPEDRKRQGLVLTMSCLENFSLALLDRLGHWGLLDQKAERTQAADYFQRLAVKTPTLQSPVASLSGGNQQKVAILKWLARPLKVLIVDEPTRGVDVGAKAAIHELLDGLAQRGMAILLISSDLPEVVGLSGRALVMRSGRIVAQVPRAQINQEHLMHLMAGVEAEPSPRGTG